MHRSLLPRPLRRAAATALTLASIGGCLAPVDLALAQPDATASQADQAKAGWTDEEIVRLVGQYGSPSTFAVAAIDFERLEPETFAKALRRVVELQPEEDQRVTAGLAEMKGKLDQAGIRQAVLLLDVHPQRMLSAVALLRIDEQSDVLATTQLLQGVKFGGLEEARFIDGVLVMRSPQQEGEKAAPKLNDVEQIRAALAAGGDAPARVALFLSPDLRRVVGELAFALGDEQAIRGAKLAAKELTYASFAFDPDDHMSLDLRLRFATPEGAAQGAELAKSGIARLRKDFPERETLPFSDETLDRMARWLTPEIAEDSSDLVLHRSLNDEETLTLFRDTIAPSIVAARAQAGRITKMNKFKQIGLAFHNFADTYRHLPLAGNQKKDGKAPGLSWRVHLLPFLEQAPLYDKFHRDEPWDSPHNKALIAEMPDIFKLDPTVPNGKTVALLPMGEGYTFSGDKPTTFADITDGTSNTLWVVQASPEEAVTWTKPEDLEVDLTEIADQLGAEGDEAFIALRGDGSVSAFPDDADPRTLHALFTRAGGEVIEEPRPAPPAKPQGARLDLDSPIGKFRQIALAFHNFYDAQRRMPLAGEQKQNGQASGLSWRVHLLPYLEQQALYRQFALDEPWDSDRNKKLIAQMPDVYKLDPNAPQGQTVVQIPLGEGFGFSGETPLTFAQITDGLSNTILAVRSAPEKAVIWTKPDDLQLDPAQAAALLGAERETDFLAVLFDGSVRKIPKDVDPETLKAALTRAGGEPATLP